MLYKNDFNLSTLFKRKFNYLLFYLFFNERYFIFDIDALMQTRMYDFRLELFFWRMRNEYFQL